MEVNLHPRRRPISYYAVLGVAPDASLPEIRSAYRKLAMKWHPDRWWTKPWLVDEANSRFKEIQEAWEVLSDQGKRALYDAGLYDPLREEADGEEIEGFSGFLQEMMALMDNVRREGKEYSLEELQSMLAEMAGGFESFPPPQPQPPSTAASAPRWFDTEEETSRAAKRFRGGRDRTDGRRSRGHVAGVESWESTSCY